jgi:hypothetical protein
MKFHSSFENEKNFTHHLKMKCLLMTLLLLAQHMASVRLLIIPVLLCGMAMLLINPEMALPIIVFLLKMVPLQETLLLLLRFQAQPIAIKPLAKPDKTQELSMMLLYQNYQNMLI